MQPTTDTMKPRARAVSSDNAKPTIVLNLPGVRVAVLTSAYDSLLHLDVTLSSAASLLLASYVACVLAWNILSFVLVLLAETAAFALISFYTFMGLAMLSMNAAAPNAASVRSYCPYASLPHKTKAAATPTLPLLCVDGATISSRSAHVGKTDDAAASKRKELQAPAARRRVLAHLNRNRLLVNVVPGDMRRRVDMNLGEANIRVGKAFVQAVPGQRKPRDIYVVRVDCGAQSAAQEKHMNPVVMWDVTASFDEFKQLERELKKEIKTKKEWRGVKVPHLSSGAVLFVQPELTDHVLNARRLRLQAFIDAVRSDPVLSTTGCLRKFCQAY
ncbi:Phox homologous domain [Phytophthora cinnamomi]|uniref:Phox homologous domain n=1 Tax=Phytophthora cinnamomi TaxID=4785 RepID=UPI00355A90C1|nr:Phox homologous domain [Phytophthora cinnamomi]